MDRVGIILVNFKSCEHTIECLESLCNLDYPDFLIVVVDNASNDESIHKINEWYEHNKKIKLTVLQASENLGFAAGNNIAIKHLLGQGIEFFWLLNNDTIVDKKALSNLMDTITNSINIGFVGSKLLFYDRPSVIQAAGGGSFYPPLAQSRHIGEGETDTGQWDKDFEVFYINGASLLVKKDVIDKIGLMNENFFMYGEELEWQIRAKRQGLNSLYVHNSKIYHKVSVSFNSEDKKFKTYYYIIRNAIIITRRYYKHFILTACLFNLLKVFYKFFRLDFKAGNAIFKGLIEGLKMNLAIFYKS